MPVIEVNGRTLLPAKIISKCLNDMNWTPFYNNEMEQYLVAY